MKQRLYVLLVLFVISSLMASGCALTHPVAPFRITDPLNNTFHRQETMITIKLSRNVDIPAEFTSFQYEIYDNGALVNTHVEPRSTAGVRVDDTAPRTSGYHSITARARAYNSATSVGDWIVATPVCIYFGPVDPHTYDCLVFGFPQHLEIATDDPSFIVIATDTPMEIIRPPSSGNNGGNDSGYDDSGNPVATGCGQYTDESSCNSAGCSWSASTCIVIP